MNHTPTHRPLRRAVLGVAAACAAVGALAACGSSASTNTVASLGSSTARSATVAPAGGSAGPSAANNAKLVKYSQCMRSHGVPGFPDPQGGRLMIQVHKGSGSSTLDPDSPQFKAASQACKSLAPAGLGSGQSVSPQMQAQALKFSRCMRSHGVPSFPDPSFSGGAVRIQAKGTNLNSPAVKRAQQACGSLMAGGAP